MSETDIAAIITGHAEGRLAVASLRSFWACVEHAEAAGLKVEPVLVLDNARPDTLAVFDQFRQGRASLLETSFSDQGAARNHAVANCTAAHIAFLDGDDLWSESWLTDAYGFLQSLEAPKRAIAHPEFNYFFEGHATIFRQIDQLAPEFDLDLLRVRNFWDALCLCHRSILEEYPFCERDIANGWAFEDWHWNMMTMSHGIQHRVVPDTVLFKRRQVQSQTVKASGSKARSRSTPLSAYSHPLYSENQEST